MMQESPIFVKKITDQCWANTQGLVDWGDWLEYSGRIYGHSLATTAPVNLETFNWSVALFLGVLVTRIAMYAVKGRKVYKSPVTDIRVARLE
jgi:hypothetical protein